MNSEKNTLPRFLRSVLASVALGLFALPACQRKDASTTSTAGLPPSFAAPAAPVPVATLINRVKGRWLRPDGGYILAITTIDADGRAEAGYFNPSPIRVAWARVKAEGAAIKIDVELRDQNYPGCLYKLIYVPERDRLLGTYFQAQMQQTYEVEFVREP